MKQTTKPTVDTINRQITMLYYYGGKTSQISIKVIRY